MQSHQVLKVSAFGFNTTPESISPLIDRFIDDALLEPGPRVNPALSQLK
jgi:hypothetical protein